MSASTSTPSLQPSDPPSPASVLFARGVIACLAIWPALRVAVDQQWGGPSSAQKRTWLAGVVVDAFEEHQNPAPDADYVEEMLLQITADEYEMQVEDDSAQDVAKNIVKLWAAAQEGNAEPILTLEERAEKLKGKKVQVEEAAGDESDWDDESDEEGSDEDDDDEKVPDLIAAAIKTAPKPIPEVDEDGFTMVKGKGKR
ncbi:hypothetical protein EIP91_008485 [Steccherinum ochraceum]|uniref:Pre-rRNA-processing protein TSR2 n=1 Tax=Steccherinum ochraceum TaxID=92696 RepID=A0A4R0RU23_9APHY|nr:hypothetical protein EIP91_008485 [Steccherinum ochraceum]